MRQLLLVGLFGIVTLNAFATLPKYRPLELDDLLRKSDLVLHGAILSLQADTFELKVAEVFAGQYKPQTITVRRFHDWTCASRWAPYAKDQKVLLCLKKITEPSTGVVSYRIRSAGGEGEMPILAKEVFIHAPHSLKVQNQNYSVYKGTIRACRVPLKDIKRLTQVLRKSSLTPREPRLR